MAPSFNSESIMKSFIGRAWMLLLGLVASIAYAQEGGEAAYVPAPTVGIFWVFVFLALFIGICGWIGFAIWNNERKNRIAGVNKTQVEA
jgi:hypothetical protein